MRNKSVLSIVLACLVLFSIPVRAGAASCTVEYSIEGWSFFYKEYKGGGVVACTNGQRLGVSIVSKGGGITFGKSKIDNGKGVFSRVYDINEIFGTYVSVAGHAGVVNSVEGQVMTKGEVSLALSGEGRGMDLGFSLSAFSIRRR